MAAYRRVYDSRHVQADCLEPGSAPEPYARYEYGLPFLAWCVRKGRGQDQGRLRSADTVEVKEKLGVQISIQVLSYTVLGRGRIQI